jgi:fumarate reductase subunit D
MPFTISHIAAVLPAQRQLRRWGVFSAAVVGSMVPDFGFLLPLPIGRGETHSAVALFTFCLPVGLAAYWLFQLLVKPAWCAVLPSGWRGRLRSEHPVARLGDWKVWLGAAAAVLAAALTHLVWDGFTHEDGRGVRMFPFLDDNGPHIEGHPLPIYQWLQLASSVLGLLVLVVAVWMWRRGYPLVGEASEPAQVAWRYPELGARERQFWFVTYLLVPIVLLVLAAAPRLHHGRLWYKVGGLLSRFALYGLGGIVVSIVLVSAIVRIRLAVLARRLDDRTGLQ